MMDSNFDLLRAQTSDSYFKISLKGVARNHKAKCDDIREHEKSLSSLDGDDLTDMAHYDTYFIGDNSFYVFGRVVEVYNDDLFDALSKLTPESRALILMSWLLGMTDKKIGSHFNLPNSTVAYRRNRAMDELRNLLAGCSYVV